MLLFDGISLTIHHKYKLENYFIEQVNKIFE